MLLPGLLRRRLGRHLRFLFGVLCLVVMLHCIRLRFCGLRIFLGCLFGVFLLTPLFFHLLRSLRRRRIRPLDVRWLLRRCSLILLLRRQSSSKQKRRRCNCYKRFVHNGLQIGATTPFVAMPYVPVAMLGLPHFRAMHLIL